MTQHPSYPDETTRRHLLALTKAGVIQPGSIRAQVAEVVADYRLIMEHAIEAEKVADSNHPRLQEPEEHAYKINGWRPH